MFTMFNRMFKAIAAFFFGIEKLGNAFVNLTTISEEMSANYLDQSRVQRIADLNALNAKYGTEVKALPAAPVTE